MTVAFSPRKQRWPRWWRRAQVAMRRSNFFLTMEVLAGLLFVAMTVATWITLSGESDATRLVATDTAATLLVGTLVPAMAILVLLGRRLALKRAEANAAGTGQLHVRLVFLFSLISAIPTLLVVIFASWLFQSLVEFWFSDNSRGLLENANKLARGYYEQTQRDVELESLGMAGDMRAFLSQQPVTSPDFSKFYSYQVVNRNLSQTAILRRATDGSLRIIAIANPAQTTGGEVMPPEYLRRLDSGEPMILTADAKKIQTYTPIDKRSGLYLYAARSSDLLAYSQGQRADNIVRSYDVLSRRGRILQLRFNVALFVASLALVGFAIWIALRFADRQVRPLYDLVAAARQVGAGNFALRVQGRTGADEVGLLNRAFNRMTGQIDRQHQDLLGANQLLRDRRAFTEAVLESVTAGVISVNVDDRIQLINSSAQKLLLENASKDSIGLLLADVAPQISALVDAAAENGLVQHPRGNDLLTLAVRITAASTGYVITFEDITRQLLDQRQAAWSDVARRIAHEIKNPLTPIQLATERLNRRYRKQISDDPALFEELTSTIIRQVGDLRKMVDEFSSFARLPKPIFRFEDPVDLARQSLFLQEVAQTGITYSFAADPDIAPISCDRHQFGQAMTNVLKNASEAIEARSKIEASGWRGRIEMRMEDLGDAVAVTISDTGIGLPQDRERIAEPYVTTRDKGTGLGLAIVKKIVEEHDGEMTFASAESGGARVTLRFARLPCGDAKRAEAAE
jgi:two-component system, NtrC family, nitrogen regulation sensor histidine kinase NtrY